LIQWLLDQNPTACKVTNTAGELPLHVAADNSACPVRILEMLASEYPEALRQKDSTGDLPLHAAVKEGCRLDAVEFLCDRYPAAVRQCNGDGDLPLHVACEGAPVDVVRFLLERYEIALRVYDHEGYLPFHLACMYHTDTAVLEYLASQWKGRQLPSTRDKVPALFVAAEHDAPLDVILWLTQHSQHVFVKRALKKQAAQDASAARDADCIGFCAYGFCGLACND
jgi:ankyrin repeat protein